MLLLVGALLGERPLVQLAVFTVALPFLSALTVARQRFRVSARRTVTPARVPRGDTAEVVLEIANADTRTGGLWMLTEQLPGDLGTPPSFVVERLGPGARTSLRYQVHGHRRGRHALGPLRLRLVDPFGLVERSAVGADSAPLIVVPRVRPLAAGGAAGGGGGGGGGGPPPPRGGGGGAGAPAARSRCTARTTSARGSTATVTTSARCTGEPPPAPVSSWSGSRSVRGGARRSSCSATRDRATPSPPTSRP